MRSGEAPTTSNPTGSAPEAETFDAFFAEVWPWAFKLATFLTQDPAAGEEIAQDVLARMYHRWGTAERPEAYLRTALANSCRNHHRHNRVQRDKLPLLAVSDRVDLACDDLADAVAALPFRQRAVIVLRYHFSLTEREIAETLGCRPGTVKSLSSRALDRLRKDVPR